MKKQYWYILIGLIVAAVAVRLLPHLPNATPLSALALVTTLYIGRRWSLTAVMLALFVSDMFIGFYDWRLMASVYSSFALIAVLSMTVSRYKRLSATLSFVIAAPLIFFLITNAAAWWLSPWYVKDLSGLIYSYELGLPFLRNMFLGDILYTASFMIVFEVVRRHDFVWVSTFLKTFHFKKI